MRSALAKIPYTRGLGIALDRATGGEVEMTLVRVELSGTDGRAVAELRVDYAFRPLENA